MMRDAHRPTEHNIIGARIQTSDRVDFVTRDATPVHDFRPRKPGELRLQLEPALAKTVKIRLVLGVCFDNALCDARQECEVAADVGLDVKTGDRAAKEQTAD